MDEKMIKITFGIICSAGEGRSLAIEAMGLAKENNDIAGAREKLAKARETLNEAHHFQTDLIQREAGGEKFDIGILLIHSQDHLMNAMTVIQMADEIISIYEKINKNN